MTIEFNGRNTLNTCILAFVAGFGWAAGTWFFGALLSVLG